MVPTFMNKEALKEVVCRLIDTGYTYVGAESWDVEQLVRTLIWYLEVQG